MAEAALPQKRVEFSKPKLETAAAKPATAELRPKLVTPEAKTNAAEMLRSRLTALQQEQTKLADDLEKHNCIKLDRLSFDYGGEITRYQNALQALEQGDTSQAIQLIEKQVVTNMKSQEDLVDSQKQTTSEYERVNNKLKAAERNLRVNPLDKLKYSNIGNIYKAYQEFATKDVDAAHPEWRKSKDTNIQAARIAEIERNQRLMMLSTPDYAAIYILNAADHPTVKIDHKRLYVWAQYEKYNALDSYRFDMAHIVSAHENYAVDNTHLDGLIESLGGPKQYDRQTVQRRKKMLDEFKAQAITDPDVRYNQILENTHSSFDEAEQQLINTYDQLFLERAEIQKALESEQAPEKQKLLNLRRSREGLLEYRLQQVWNVHMERKSNSGKESGYPYSLATLHDRSVYRHRHKIEQEDLAKPSTV